MSDEQKTELHLLKELKGGGDGGVLAVRPVGAIGGVEGPAGLPAAVAVPGAAARRPRQSTGEGREEVEETPADDDVVVESHDVGHETGRHADACNTPATDRATGCTSGMVCVR